MWLTCPYCVSRERARIAKKSGKKRCRECSQDEHPHYGIHGVKGVPQDVMFRSRRNYRLCFLHHLEYEDG
jgi:hypothetical protein